MDLGQSKVGSAHQHRPLLYRRSSEEYSSSAWTPTNLVIEPEFPPRNTSFSSDDVETVVRWQTPPSRVRTPNPQSSYETVRPEREDIGANEAAYASNNQLVVRFDEDQIRNTEVEAENRPGRMEDREDFPPTPNTDDTPYIRFAIDQLTRDEEVKAGDGSQPSSRQSLDYPVERLIPDVVLGPMTADREREAMRLVRKHRSSPSPEEGRLFNFNATRPLSYPSVPEPPIPIMPRISEIFIPVEPPSSTRYPSLTYVPTILRPLSMTFLMLLYLLMTAAIIFSAIYSARNDGLMRWKDGIYGGRYFVFGFLPQILASVIFAYVQAVMAAITRILPYVMMANEDSQHRAGALFLGLFPRSLLFPRWKGPPSFEVAHSLLWLSVFTIPLQGCIFSAVQFDGVWKWTAVQPVAWVLVAIYLLMFLATAVFGIFFFRRTTGLMWDPKSLADIIALLPRSNSLKDYLGTDMMSRRELVERLEHRRDRLGYWRTQNKNQGIFYCIGEHGAARQRSTLSRGHAEKGSVAISVNHSIDLEKFAPNFNQIRSRYLPWLLRDTFVVLWVVAAFFLLLALYIVSFLPSTAIHRGFAASVAVLPERNGFSAANFLYSFVPAIIGMLLYIFFSSMEMTIRKLQPWTELGADGGATASQSLLLEYTSQSSLFCAFSALRNRHYRVAIFSIVSRLFLLLPILAGGLFFPLTTPARQVRMIPNLPAFYIILALLTVYFFALLLLIPGRKKLAMPHDVDCLAEIISFVYASQVVTDAAFRAPKTKADLVTRLTAVGARGDVKRFGFGVLRDVDGNEVFNIDRIGRPGNEVLILKPSNR